MKRYIAAVAMLGSTYMLIGNSPLPIKKPVPTQQFVLPAGLPEFIVEDMNTPEAPEADGHYDSTWVPSKKHERAEKLLAGMMFGECRGQGEKCMDAVGHVAMNRARQGLDDRYGKGLWGVLKKRKAFSCFLKSDPNKRVIDKAMKGKLRQDTADADRWKLAVKIAHGLMHNPTKDPTQNATYYHATYMTARWTNDRGMEKTVKIAGHVFYKKDS